MPPGTATNRTATAESSAAISSGKKQIRILLRRVTPQSRGATWRAPDASTAPVGFPKVPRDTRDRPNGALPRARRARGGRALRPGMVPMSPREDNETASSSPRVEARIDPLAWCRRHDRRHGPERVPVSARWNDGAAAGSTPRGWSSEEGEGQPRRRGKQRQDVARSARRVEGARARDGQERTQARHQADGDKAIGGGGAKTKAHRRGRARVGAGRDDARAAGGGRGQATRRKWPRRVVVHEQYQRAVAEGGDRVLLVLRTVQGSIPRRVARGPCRVARRLRRLRA